MKRFVVDEEQLALMEQVLKAEPGDFFYREELRQKAKRILNEAKEGRPPMRDILQDVSMWVLLRMTELSIGQYGLPGWHSDVSIVFQNQKLWGIEDENELRKAMIEIIEALPD